MGKIIKLLEKIEKETRDVNMNFIYNFIVSNKKEINKNDFLVKTLKEISQGLARTVLASPTQEQEGLSNQT